MGQAATRRVVEAAAPARQEEADPFEMLSGMGQEEVYRITLMTERTAAVPSASAGEEEAAGDMVDPFEMMGGMGQEEVYKVTLMEDQETKDAAEEEAGDMADPFEMMGGMGQEEVYKVTLM